MAAITVPGMFLTGDHASRPAASAVGGGSLYSCTTHNLVYQSDTSSWTTWATLGGSGSVATDAIWDAAGDLAVGTGANAAARLAIGSSGEVLTVVGGTASWETPAGSAAIVPTVYKTYAKDAQNTASWSKAVTAVPTDRRLIVCVASYARDVNTPTLTNVTFTEVLAVNNGSVDTGLSIFIGVPSSTSGTTLGITATGANWIIADIYEVYDALTPTFIDSATATDEDAASFAGTLIGPVSPNPDIGTFYIAAAAQNDGSTGFTGTTMSTGDGLATKIAAGANAGLVSAIGRVVGSLTGFTYTGGTSGGDLAAGIVTIS